VTDLTLSTTPTPERPPGRPVTRRVLRWIAGIAGVLIILMALLIGAMRIALTHLPEYRDQIQAWVNETSHLDVRFKGMDARWRFYGPELFVSDVAVLAPNGGPLLAKAHAASIGFDMWRAVLHAEVLPARITLLQPEIGVVRTPDGRIELEGQAALEDREHRFTFDDLPTGLLSIEEAKVTFTDQQGKLSDLILRGVEVGLRRDRDDLEFEGQFELPSRMGTRLAFEGEARGDLGALDSLGWRIDAKANAIDLKGWHEFLGHAFTTPSAGRGRIRATAAFKGATVSRGSLQLQLADVLIPASTVWPSDTSYSTIAGDVRLEHEGSAWHARGRDLKLITRAHAWEPARISASWSRGDSGVIKLEADANYLRLENLVPLAALAPQSAWRDRLSQLLPEGEIRALKLNYAAGDSVPPLYQATAHFAELGFAPVDNGPGLRGLRGEMTTTETAGRASVDSQALVLSMPLKFRAPLSADTARGDVHWEHSAEGWRISTRGFAVRNAHAKAEADLDLLLPGDASSPILKIRSHFRDAVLAEAWRYLPIDKLPEKVLAWLDGAAVTGRAPSGEFVFDGPTRSFPFRNGEGEFRISFPVTDMRLHYAPGWPDFENLAADIEFRNAGLTGIVHGATLNGLKVENCRAQFVDFRTGVLTINGRAAGDVGDALGYLQKSPLADNLGNLFADLRGKGPVAAKVDLVLPVKDMERRNVLVSAELDNGVLSLVDTAHVVEGLQGVIEFKGKLLSATDLVGTYLGGPAHIDLTPEVAPGRADNVIHVRAQTPVPALRRAFDAPDLLAADGTLDWRGVMRIPVDNDDATALSARRPVILRVNSSLRGTEIDLPDPLAKPAGDVRALRVDAQWPDASLALVRVSYGADARSQLSFQRDRSGWRFDRGGVRFGDSDARLPTTPGLEVSGTVQRLDVSQWLALNSDKPSDGKGKRPLSDYLRSVELTVSDFQIFGMRFPDVSGSLLPAPKSWSVTVDGPKAHGTVQVPFNLTGDEPLAISMTRLAIGPAEEEADDSTETHADPTQWPNITASIDDFEAYGRHLGATHAEIKRVAGGLSMESFTASTAAHELTGTGTWVNPPTGQRGTLKLRLESTDLKQTLQDLGYGPGVAAKHALLQADVSWPGAPSSTLLGRLNGTMKVEVEDGQLLNVQPGAGRVFGLLSIATLPRRLSLDFSDLTDKGFAFDGIHGDFSLESGDAYTQNLLLKGPAAEIGMVGRTGLARHDYDQTVVVTGSLGQSLPAAGLIAGGPAVGAAMLLFSQIFKEPLKGMARGYYRITGPWESPNVQRVEASDVKKTENALHVVEKRKEKG